MFLLLARKHLQSQYAGEKKKHVTARQTLHLPKQRRAQRCIEVLQLTFPTKLSGALPLVLDVSLHFVQLLSKHSAGLEIQHTLVAGAAGGRRISYWSRAELKPPAESHCLQNHSENPVQHSVKITHHFFHFVSQEDANVRFGMGGCRASPD